jgi:hypothetical protein
VDRDCGSSSGVAGLVEGQDVDTGSRPAGWTDRRTSMNATYTPMIDPLGAAPRIALFLVFAVTALVTLIRLAPIA